MKARAQGRRTNKNYKVWDEVELRPVFLGLFSQHYVTFVPCSSLQLLALLLPPSLPSPFRSFSPLSASLTFFCSFFSSCSALPSARCTSSCVRFPLLLPITRFLLSSQIFCFLVPPSCLPLLSFVLHTPPSTSSAGSPPSLSTNPAFVCLISRTLSLYLFLPPLPPYVRFVSSPSPNPLTGSVRLLSCRTAVLLLQGLANVIGGSEAVPFVRMFHGHPSFHPTNGRMIRARYTKVIKQRGRARRCADAAVVRYRFIASWIWRCLCPRRCSDMQASAFMVANCASGTATASVLLRTILWSKPHKRRRTIQNWFGQDLICEPSTLKIL